MDLNDPLPTGNRGYLNGDPASFPQHDKGNLEDFRAALSRAMQGAGVPPPAAPVEPELPQLLAAAFRQANTLGAVLNSQTLREHLSPTRENSPISPEDMLARLKSEGLGHHANLFTDVTTLAQYEARLADLKQELKDRETLRASGGLMSELALGLLDPINLVPIAGGVAKANAGMKAVAKAGAITGLGSAVLSEAVLQEAQVTRSWEEGAINVAASTIFGAGLGMGALRLADLVGQPRANKIETRVDAAMTDLAAGGPKMADRVDAAVKLHEELLPARGKALEDGPNAERVRAIDDEIALRSNGADEISPEVAALQSERAQLLDRDQGHRLGVPQIQEQLHEPR